MYEQMDRNIDEDIMVKISSYLSASFNALKQENKDKLLKNTKRNYTLYFSTHPSKNTFHN
jgi:hypothetical protein